MASRGQGSAQEASGKLCRGEYSSHRHKAQNPEGVRRVWQDSGRECGTQSLGSPTPCSEVCQGVWKPLSVNSKHKASALNFARGGSETETLTNLSLTYHSFLANDPGTLPNSTDGVPSLQHFASPQTPVSQRFPHDFSHYCCLRFNHRKF